MDILAQGSGEPWLSDMRFRTPCRSRHPSAPSARSCALLTWGFVLALSGVSFAAEPTPVTCGDTMSGKGALTGDCIGTITILKGTLELQGFTITGTGLAAIDCQAGCKIRGPGTIVGAGSSYGILSAGRVTASEIAISGHGTGGIFTVGEVGAISIVDVDVTGNGTGISGTRIKAKLSDISGNTGTGIATSLRGARVSRCTIIGNGKDGIAADVVASARNRVKISNSIVSDNGEFGIIARAIKSKTTSVSGSGIAAECDAVIPCADLGSVTLPKLTSGAACDESMMVPEEFIPPLPFGDPWGVCTADP